MNEIEEINSFLTDTQHLLCFLVSVRDGFVPKDNQADLLESWPQIVEINTKLKRDVEKATLEQLSQIGFTGSQLRLKLNSFRYAHKHWIVNVKSSDLGHIYEQSHSNPVQPDPALRLGFVLRKIVDHTLAVLKFVNSILGSMRHVSIFADGLKEFKEVLENLLHTKKVIEGS